MTSGEAPFLTDDEIEAVRVIVRSFPPTWHQYRYFTGLLAERDAQAARIAALEGIVREILDQCGGDEPCRLDHNGFCQEHASRPCLVAEARALLGAK